MEQTLREDFILPFQVDSLDVRGRIVTLGPCLTEIARRHNYPDPIISLLGEALSLTALMGASLKFEGKFIFQIKSDGPVDLLVCDFTTPGDIRAYAHFDEDKVLALSKSDTFSPVQLLGKGAIAFTLDQGEGFERYQGIVPLEEEGLSASVHGYFMRSEQIPTFVTLSSGSVLKAEGDKEWRAGGLMIQHLPPGGFKPGDYPGGDGDENLEDMFDSEEWNRARILAETTASDELIDPTLEAERLLYRLYHEEGIRIFEQLQLQHACGCSRDKIFTVFSQFTAGDVKDMVKDNKIDVTCEFCSETYVFEEDEVKELTRDTSQSDDQ